MTKKLEELFEWKGQTFGGYEEVIDAALSMQGPGQEKFVEAYCAIGPYARQNIGYFSGYYDEDKRKKILEIFHTAHPIFGTERPSPETALKMGKMLGESIKKGKRR